MAASGWTATVADRPIADLRVQSSQVCFAEVADRVDAQARTGPDWVWTLRFRKCLSRSLKPEAGGSFRIWMPTAQLEALASC